MGIEQFSIPGSTTAERFELPGEIQELTMVVDGSNPVRLALGKKIMGGEPTIASGDTITFTRPTGVNFFEVVSNTAASAVRIWVTWE